MGVTSAEVTYSAVEMAGAFNYEASFRNTSPAPYAIYAALFGYQFNVPPGPFPLKDVVLISSPPGWVGGISAAGIDWGTNFQGNAVAAGYIFPGQSGKFVFQSSTAAPSKMPFGCCFYDGNNSWGFCFNGTAQLIDRGPTLPVPAVYDPWWWIKTHGGLVPPGPPPPWMQEFVGALTLGVTASGVSPQLRAGVLELVLEQISIASAGIKRDIKALQKK